MANTYKLIASSTVGSGGTASVTFSSIPSTYTDLQIVLSPRNNNNDFYDNLNIAFNGSSSSLSGKGLQGNGSSASSFSVTNYLGETNGATSTANTFSNISIYIPNYTSSNYKSYSVDNTQENNSSTSLMGLYAGLWSNTAAITSITLSGPYSSYVQYSNFYLYGIKNS
jgi:hypothetical protein